MPAIMLPSRAEMVADGGPTADGEDLMHLERRIVACAGELVLEGITHADRGGIDDVPVLDAAQNARQIDLLGAGIGQSTVRQRGHELFQRLVKPAIEGRAGDSGALKFQIRPQHVTLVRASRRAGGDDHRPHQHPEVQLALPLDDPELRAQALDLLVWQDRLKHLSHVLTRHDCSLQWTLLTPDGLMKRLEEVDHIAPWTSSPSWPGLDRAAGLSGHICELDFVFSRTEKNEETGGYRSKGDQWEKVKISWDQIFALLGPSILRTNWEYWSASRELGSYVERHVRHHLAEKY